LERWINMRQDAEIVSSHLRVMKNEVHWFYRGDIPFRDCIYFI